MMKRALFILVCAIFITGCAEGPMGVGTLGNDAQEASGETGDLFGDQPVAVDEGIPIEGDEPALAEKKPAVPGAKAQVIKPVEITKTADLGTCVIGEACERKMNVQGGSGEYVWSLVGGNLPKGLELVDTTAKKARIQKASGEEIDEVGEFAFTLKVEDAADATRSAEREFTLKVNEHIAMTLYAMSESGDGQTIWTPIQEKDANGDAVPVTIPPKKILLVEVIGHAPSYTWSINGQEIVCNDQACAGTKDGLRLYKDTNLVPPEPHPEHFAYMILKAEEDFIGQEAKNVVIAAAQDYGDPVSKTISSITFQQEPCKIPLTVTGGTTIERSYGETYDAVLTIQGGEGAVIWTPLGDTAQIPEEKAKMTINNEGGRQVAVSGKVDVGAGGLTLAQYLQGETIVLQYEVTDSCPQPNKATVDVTIVVKGDEELLKVNPKKRSSTLHLGANDTDSSSTIKLFLTDALNEEVGSWTEAVGLDQYGDGHTCWYCYDIDGNHSVSQPSMEFVSGLSVDKIQKVRFYIKDPGSGGWVDVKINEYHINFPHWSGAAQGVNSDMDDIDDGSYREFDIEWTYTTEEL